MWQLTVHIWVAFQVLDSPVANWDSDMVHARGRNLVDVILGDEGAPMLRQNSTTLLGAQSRAESPLINGASASRVEN